MPPRLPRWRLRVWAVIGLLVAVAGGSAYLLHERRYASFVLPAQKPPVGAWSLKREDAGKTQFQMQTEKGRYRMESGGTGLSDMPYGFLPYPGAHILQNVRITDPGATEGQMVRFTTIDPPEKVAAFYRQQAHEALLAIVTDTEINGAILVAGTYPDHRDGGFQLSASRRGDGGTEVALSSGFGLDVTAQVPRDRALDSMEPLGPPPLHSTRASDLNGLAGRGRRR